MSIKFTDNSEAVKAALEQAILAGLEEAAGEIESQTKRNSRVGQACAPTKNSWQHRVEQKGEEYTATIGSDKENAIWEEFGTGEYALEGKGRKGAWYVPVESVTGYKKPTYNGKVIIVYGKNGQQFYKTNGKKPSRAFWRAYTEKKNTAIRLIQRKINQALKK